MNMLLSPSNDVVLLVTNLYNISGGGNPVSTSSAPSNLFGLNSATSTQNTGVFGGSSSVFGLQSQTNANPFAGNAAGFGGNATSNANSIFGSSSFGAAQQNNSMFGNQNKPSIFGQSSTTNAFGQQQQPTSGGVFGTQQNTTGGSIFGIAQPQSTAGSIFGGAQNTITNTGSIFGGNSMSTNSSFGMQTSQPSIQPSSNIFSMGAAASQSNPTFGGPATFGSNQQSSGIFGQANTSMGQTPTSSSSIFGQSIQSVAPFGSAIQQNDPNSFGNFAQQPQIQQQSSIFGQQTPAQNQTSIFGGMQGQQQMPTTSAFGSSVSSSNIFGTPSVQSAPIQASTNIFSGNPISIGSTMMTNPNQNQSIFSSNSFQNAPTNQMQSSQGMFQSISNVIVSSTLYSKAENLNQNDLAAFSADVFVLGEIPIAPPPVELCM